MMDTHSICPRAYAFWSTKGAYLGALFRKGRSQPLYMVSTRAHLTHFDKYAISNKPIDGFGVIGLTQLFVCPHFDLNCHFCHEICEKKVSIEIDK